MAVFWYGERESNQREGAWRTRDRALSFLKTTGLVLQITLKGIQSCKELRMPFYFPLKAVSLSRSEKRGRGKGVGKNLS